ncbi:amino acid adenylation domain-containing protein [Streptomyces genisteinicus]|uniref:amino acid adenylation domain-containing protein n=1 Tax=Streptomyces genisteinicus TaxID=2768068 RepID=UPI001FEB677D|nr:amino acid adenylation domain-containing protein [Streptomyces genisteinicus]
MHTASATASGPATATASVPATGQATARPAPVVRSVHAHVRATPGAVALRDARGGTTGYAELWERATATARELRRTGVTEGGLVAVHLPAGPEAVVAMLGTWLAGAAVLPLDTATPEERRTQLLGSSGACAVIDHRDGGRPRPLDGGRPVGGDPAVRPAYVIHTSGSTGTPKGVLVGHEALAGHVTACAGLFGLTAADTVLQFASIGFDVAQEEIWPTLAAGGTLAFREPGVPDAASLAATARDLGVTVLQLPTAYWRMLCGELDGASAPSFGGVRTVVIGGENATTADARAHRRSPLGHTTLVNGYGPTETVVTATALVLAPNTPVPDTAGLPIGGPVGERLLHVLDERRLPAADGTGELWIGGPLLADGYLHDPERTRERFLPDPYAEAPGARMYRTGDLVRRLAGGGLEFLGRVDNQVKVRGHRIELDEADRHLMDTPGVAAAAAFTLDDGDGGRLLAAAVTAAPGTALTPQAVREHLRERVPAQLVPGRLAVLERMPLTVSGKIDRRAAEAAVAALTAEPGGETPGERPGETPATALDALVAAVRQLIQAPGFGPDDDFLAHGGDSLTALRICATMRSRGLPLHPADLLTGRTARAAAARAARRAAPAPGDGREADGPLGLLPAQRRWLLDGDLPEPDHFCLNALFTTTAAPDTGRLRAIAHDLLVRHPALRTALAADGTVRLTEPDPAAAVHRADLRHLSADEAGGRLHRLLADTQRSLSLADGRVFRLTWADLPDGTARLLLTVHHFVLDGVSMGLLGDDLEALLDGRVPDRSATGPRAAGAALADWLTTPEARSDAARWAGAAAGAAPLRPALDGPVTLPTLRTHRARIGADATRLVTHELPRTGVAPHDFALGCLVGGLARWTGEATHGVDVYAHSRDVFPGELDLSRTVSYVQSTFPAVLTWRGDGPDALRGALAGLAALPARRYGFDALRFGSPEASERAALAARPRPDVRLNFRGHLMRLEQRAPGSVLAPAAEDFGAHRSPLQRERYLLMAEGDIVGGELEMSYKYSTGHWRPEQIEALARAVGQVMTEVLAGTGGDRGTAAATATAGAR